MQPSRAKGLLSIFKASKINKRNIIQEASDRSKNIVKGRHVLCIQDSSEVIAKDTGTRWVTNGGASNSLIQISASSVFNTSIQE